MIVSGIAKGRFRASNLSEVVTPPEEPEVPTVPAAPSSWATGWTFNKPVGSTDFAPERGTLSDFQVFGQAAYVNDPTFSPDANVIKFGPNSGLRYSSPSVPTQFTLEMWLRIGDDYNGTGYAKFFTAANNVGGAEKFYILNLLHLPLMMYAGNANFYAGSQSLQYNKGWNHIAAVRNGDVFSGYLNGVLGTSATITGVGANYFDNTQITINGGMSSPQAAPNYSFSNSFANLSLTHGVKYTSNFTPSKTPN